jgi:hypothetical protein
MACAGLREREEGLMGLRLSAQARREVTQHMVSRYWEASAPLKGTLLDELVATTGYARRYALRLLTHPPQGRRPPKRPRPRHYGPDVQHALFLAWHAANRICPKRLMPFLPTLIEALERDHQFPVSAAYSMGPRNKGSVVLYFL